MPYFSSALPFTHVTLVHLQHPSPTPEVVGEHTFDCRPRQSCPFPWQQRVLQLQVHLPSALRQAMAGEKETAKHLLNQACTLNALL